MSDNKTVPSAETILKEKGITGLTENHNYQYLHRSILEAMHEYRDLHLEAMAKEIAYNMFDTKYRDIVMNKATDYTSKLK